jgi:hypothetical protein
MNLFTIVSLGIGASVIAACAVWFFLRESSDSASPDLGSISRNWIMEHKNDRD